MSPCHTTSVPKEMDKASVSIVSRVDVNISILTRTTECHNVSSDMNSSS